MLTPLCEYRNKRRKEKSVVNGDMHGADAFSGPYRVSLSDTSHVTFPGGTDSLRSIRTWETKKKMKHWIFHGDRKLRVLFKRPCFLSATFPNKSVVSMILTNATGLRVIPQNGVKNATTFIGNHFLVAKYRIVRKV